MPQTAVQKWAGVGPYYAMFPVSFAFEVVAEHTQAGGAVLDPFAGRASSIYAAYASGRVGTGIEINEVGWLYGWVKMAPAKREEVEARLREVAADAEGCITDEQVQEMPEFFHYCYAPAVLRFLLYARQALHWRIDRVDATLMVLILIDLHGKQGSALSNQTRQSKAMAPDYSVRWWQAKGFTPPILDPVDFLQTKINRRYRWGIPEFDPAATVQGDCLEQLPLLRETRPQIEGYQLLFTSPPYYNVTSYYNDQWLRRWMLGGPTRPCMQGTNTWEKKFSSRTDYQQLIEQTFRRSAPLLSPNATVYVRTHARPFTRDLTRTVLTETFPDKEINEILRPVNRPTQTDLFRNRSTNPGEVDFVLQPRRCIRRTPAIPNATNTPVIATA